MCTGWHKLVYFVTQRGLYPFDGFWSLRASTRLLSLPLYLLDVCFQAGLEREGSSASSGLSAVIDIAPGGRSDGPPLTDYQVHISTSDLPNAGTGSQVGGLLVGQWGRWLAGLGNGAH